MISRCHCLHGARIIAAPVAIAIGPGPRHVVGSAYRQGSWFARYSRCATQTKASAVQVEPDLRKCNSPLLACRELHKSGKKAKSRGRAPLSSSARSPPARQCRCLWSSRRARMCGGKRASSDWRASRLRWYPRPGSPGSESLSSDVLSPSDDRRATSALRPDQARVGAEEVQARRVLAVGPAVRASPRISGERGGRAPQRRRHQPVARLPTHSQHTSDTQ